MQLRIFGAFAQIHRVLVEYCSSGEDVLVDYYCILVVSMPTFVPNIVFFFNFSTCPL